MMEEIKRGFKLIRYGYGKMVNVFGGIAVFLLGTAIYWSAMDQMCILGAVYIALGALMIIQVQYSLLYSNFVGASARRKTLEILLADIICIVVAVFAYVIMVGATIVKVEANPQLTSDILENMLISGVAMPLVFIMIATSYKFFWTTMILFGVFFLAVYGGGMIFVHIVNLNLSVVGVSLICLVLMIVSVILSCVLRRLLYRRSLSPTACNTGLRKAMQ